MRRDMRKIGDCDAIVANQARKALDFVVGNAEKFLKQAQLVHQLKGRWMDGVAAKVAQKIRMLLQHRHAHACAG